MYIVIAAFYTSNYQPPSEIERLVGNFEHIRPHTYVLHYSLAVRVHV